MLLHEAGQTIKKDSKKELFGIESGYVFYNNGGYEIFSKSSVLPCFSQYNYSINWWNHIKRICGFNHYVTIRSNLLDLELEKSLSREFIKKRKKIFKEILGPRITNYCSMGLTHISGFETINKKLRDSYKIFFHTEIQFSETSIILKFDVKDSILVTMLSFEIGVDFWGDSLKTTKILSTESANLDVSEWSELEILEFLNSDTAANYQLKIVLMGANHLNFKNIVYFPEFFSFQEFYFFHKFLENQAGQWPENKSTP